MENKPFDIFGALEARNMSYIAEDALSLLEHEDLVSAARKLSSVRDVLEKGEKRGEAAFLYKELADKRIANCKNPAFAAKCYKKTNLHRLLAYDNWQNGRLNSFHVSVSNKELAPLLALSSKYMWLAKESMLTSLTRHNSCSLNRVIANTTALAVGENSVVAGDSSGYLHFLTMEGEPLRTVYAHRSMVKAIATSRPLVAAAGKSISIWRADSFGLYGNIDVGFPADITSLALDWNGGKLGICALHQPPFLYDMGSLQFMKHLHGRRVVDYADTFKMEHLAPNQILTAGRRQLVLWDLRSPVPAREWYDPEEARITAMAADGTLAFLSAADSYQSTIKLWDIREDKSIVQYPCATGVLSIEIDCSALYYSTSTDVYKWDFGDYE